MSVIFDVHSVEEAVRCLHTVGEDAYPLTIMPAYVLGGAGRVNIGPRDDFEAAVADRLACSPTTEVRLLFHGAMRAASGIETEGQDGGTRLGAKHESPTAESGDAQPLEPKD